MTDAQYLTVGEASPFYFMTVEGKDDPQKFDCMESYGMTTMLNWYGASDTGIESSEQPVCTDDVGWDCANSASSAMCKNEDIFRWYCPESCNVYGWGPSVCDGGATCKFQPVATEDCPAPNTLEPNTGYYPDCMDVYF